jgi:hypothetical protein
LEVRLTPLAIPNAKRRGVDRDHPADVVNSVVYAACGASTEIAMDDHQTAFQDCLCSLLYQLRDDLAEFLFRLESGQMSSAQVMAGTKAELEQILVALDRGPGVS